MTADAVPATPTHDDLGPGEGLRCPLCEYDLRGLAEPRCPECGYAFDWAELTDPARRMHRYLFEHHPERNVWSFVRTLIGGLRPRRFWAELSPAQPSRPGRLALYAIVIVLSAVPPAVLPTVAAAHYSWNRMIAVRQRFAVQFKVRPPPVWSFGGAPTTMTAQQALDAFAPAPTWRAVFRDDYPRMVLLIGLRGYAVMLLWPILTLAAMMIFAVSMRRARLRRIHLVRCVVYAADALLWAHVVATLLSALALVRLFAGLDLPLDERPALNFLQVLAVVGFAYRLCVAFKRYLRFDHPVLTVLSTQVIVLLATTLVALFVLK